VLDFQRRLLRPRAGPRGFRIGLSELADYKNRRVKLLP
jgi:hypothetical protein